MKDAFGVVISKDDKPESTRARRRRIAEEKAQGITAQTKAQPKPEAPKAEVPGPSEIKTNPPKEAPKPGGNMGGAPQEAAQPKPPAEKPEKTMGRAFEVGQKRAFREGKGPITSAWRGVKYAAGAHPGKTTAIIGGTTAGVAGVSYLGGRAQQKKRDGK